MPLWSVYINNLPFLESKPKILLRSDSDAVKNGDVGDCRDSLIWVVIEFWPIGCPKLILLFDTNSELKGMLPFATKDAKRPNVGVLQGDGEVWRLSRGSDPLVIILSNEKSKCYEPFSRR